MNQEIEKFVKRITDSDEKAVLKMLDPDPDRVEMGGVYEDVLGYNPITFFDEYETRTKLAQMVNRLPATVRSDVQKHYEDIIIDVMSGLDELRSGTIEDLLKESMSRIVDSDVLDMVFIDSDERDDDEDDYPVFEEDEDVDLDKEFDDLNDADVWDDQIHLDDDDED